MTVAEIIDALGGAPEISRRLNMPPTTVFNWRARGSIPARYHQRVLEIGSGAVTAEQMIEAHAVAERAA